MQLEVQSVVEGKVTGITNFGVFINLGEGKTGMVHISEVASTYVKEIKDYVTVGQSVKVKVLSIGDDGKVSLSMKKAEERQPEERKRPERTATPSRPDYSYEWSPKKDDNNSFEDMMSKFKQSSEEKMGDLKRSVEGKRGGSSRRGGK